MKLTITNIVLLIIIGVFAFVLVTMIAAPIQQIAYEINRLEPHLDQISRKIDSLEPHLNELEQELSTVSDKVDDSLILN